MKKWLALLLVLVMLFPTACVAATTSIPDFKSYAGGLVKDRSDKKHEDLSYLSSRYYEGTSSEIKEALEEYADLLIANYDFTLGGYFEPDSSNYTRIVWLDYTGSLTENGFNISNSSVGWRIVGCDVYLEYAEIGNKKRVEVSAADSFVFSDTSDRWKQAASAAKTSAPKATNAPKVTNAPSGGKSCSTCGGGCASKKN